MYIHIRMLQVDIWWSVGGLVRFCLRHYHLVDGGKL
jgi:hypothetical protein